MKNILKINSINVVLLLFIMDIVKAIVAFVEIGKEYAIYECGYMFLKWILIALLAIFAVILLEKFNKYKNEKQ